MGKRVSGHVDLKSLIQKAESFDFACKVIQAHGPGRVVAGFALVVNSAWTCEAFMKALTLAERRLNPLETHNLRHLFDDMSDDAQAEVQERFEIEILPKLQQSINAPGLPTKLTPPTSFGVALDRSARAFIDFRYANQSNKPMHYHLIGMPVLLRDRLYRIRPDLVPGFNVSRVPRSRQPNENDRKPE
jgi:hypothetical protein